MFVKAGLCRSIRNLKWFEDVDYSAVYPRCYNLTEQDDLEEFVGETLSQTLYHLLLTESVHGRGFPAFECHLGFEAYCYGGII